MNEACVVNRKSVVSRRLWRDGFPFSRLFGHAGWLWPQKLYSPPNTVRLRGMVMPSFDIVSKLDLAEVDNALAGLAREISTRFDFKESKSSVKRTEAALTILADDELKLRQVQELLRMHMGRRKVDPAALDFKDPEKAAGQSVRQTVALRQGI